MKKLLIILSLVFIMGCVGHDTYQKYSWGIIYDMERYSDTYCKATLKFSIHQRKVYAVFSDFIVPCNYNVGDTLKFVLK